MGIYFDFLKLLLAGAVLVLVVTLVVVGLKKRRRSLAQDGLRRV